MDLLYSQLFMVFSTHLFKLYGIYKKKKYITNILHYKYIHFYIKNIIRLIK